MKTNNRMYSLIKKTCFSASPYGDYNILLALIQCPPFNSFPALSLWQFINSVLCQFCVEIFNNKPFQSRNCKLLCTENVIAAVMNSCNQKMPHIREVNQRLLVMQLVLIARRILICLTGTEWSRSWEASNQTIELHPWTVQCRLKTSGCETYAACVRVFGLSACMHVAAREVWPTEAHEWWEWECERGSKKKKHNSMNRWLVWSDTKPGHKEKIRFCLSSAYVGHQFINGTRIFWNVFHKNYDSFLNHSLCSRNSQSNLDNYTDCTSIGLAQHRHTRKCELWIIG